MVREGSVIGDNVIFGTSTELEGNLKLGDFVFTYNNVHLCQTSVVGDFVWLFPYVVLINDPHPPSVGDKGPTVGDYSVLCTRSTVLPGVHIGRDAFIGSNTAVNRDVPDMTIAIGDPMTLRGSVERIRMKETRKPAYPWRRHFFRNYPPHIVDQWKREFPDG